MALQVHEITTSRTVSESQGRVTATRLFRVYDDAVIITNAITIIRQFGSSLPAVGDEFPLIWGVYAKSYDVKPIEHANGVWEVQFNYESGVGGTVQPQQVGYTDFTVDFVSEFRDTWRVGPQLYIPPDGDPGNTASTAGCNGSAIDSAGIPASVLARKGAVQFTETVLLSTLDQRLTNVATSVGFRNSTWFRGFERGTLLYMGAAASRIALDRVSLTHRFAYDYWYHMIQMPHRGPDGQVLLFEVQGVLVAENVWWRQPFPSKFDFNTLSENF